MATVALWHLGVTAILASALLLVILVQSVGNVLRRLRAGSRPAVAEPVQLRPVVQSQVVVASRPVRTGVRAGQEPAPAMAAASGA